MSDLPDLSKHGIPAEEAESIASMMPGAEDPSPEESGELAEGTSPVHTSKHLSESEASAIATMLPSYEDKASGAGDSQPSRTQGEVGLGEDVSKPQTAPDAPTSDAMLRIFLDQIMEGQDVDTVMGEMANYGDKDHDGSPDGTSERTE